MKQRKAPPPIPTRYVPRRIFTLWRHGEIGRRLVWASGMFCYFEHREWLLFSGVTTNFPQAYKVQSSLRVRTPRASAVQDRPAEPAYSILRDGLIEGLSFRDLALRAGHTGAARTLHRIGKQLLRKNLEDFAKQIG